MQNLKSLQYVIRKLSDSLSLYRSKWHRQCIGRLYIMQNLKSLQYVIRTLSRPLLEGFITLHYHATHERVLDFLRLFLCYIK